MYSKYELDEIEKILENTKKMYRFLQDLKIEVIYDSNEVMVEFENLDGYSRQDNKYIFEFPIKKTVDNRKIGELTVEEFKEVQKNSAPIYEADNIVDNIEELLGVHQEFSIKTDKGFPIILSEILPEKVIFHFGEGADLQGPKITYNKSRIEKTEVGKVVEDLGLEKCLLNLIKG